MMNEYEIMVERNRAARLALLKSVGIDEAKASLRDVLCPAAKKKARRVHCKVEKTAVFRNSQRVAKLDIDYSADALYKKAMKDARDAGVPKIIPPKLPLKEALYFNHLHENFVKDINIQNSGIDSKFISYNLEDLKKLKLEESNLAKVTPERIDAMAWHPAADTFILTAGSRKGNLGIWNVNNSESSPYVLKTHLDAITNLQFNPWNPVQLVSSSRDGTLRCGDMVEQLFSELYNVADQTACTYFDFLSSAAFLVAQKNGKVAIVDNRTGEQCEKHDCHDNHINTVSVHPANKNYFLTAGKEGLIRLWDLRDLQKDPITEITHHKDCVNSAFFSPLTGNFILTTSLDDSVCVFDCPNLTDKCILKSSKRHCIGNGERIEATWLPNSDNAFVIGSMQNPRNIQMYDNKMNILHLVIHKHLTITCSNVFHPFRPALAGGNRYGKVFVFT